MSFTSLPFFAFLIPVVLGYHLLPWRVGRWFLLAASYVFYGAFEPWYCVLPFLSTLIDYVAGLRIGASSSARQRYRWLMFSIVGNLTLLGLFKYADFAILNLNHVLDRGGAASFPSLGLLLPLGISFYTFQTMSYTIDVYRGVQQPERDFGAFALYVVFFPQLVAGPIERARRLLPQLMQRNRVDQTDIDAGIERILWGLVKKLVVADRLGLMVDTVFANPGAFSSSEFFVATVGFCLQLYLDFSAYTDIAIGTARLLGVRLSENFNYPFLASSPTDFWSRWHMSLTSWFRDYVYTSLGGTQRTRPLSTAARVVLVMTLVGLWHGAEWHFVMFGLLSGIAIVGHATLRLVPRRSRRGPLLGRWWWSPFASRVVGLTAIGVIMVFFRASGLDTAVDVLVGIASARQGWSAEFTPQLVLVVVVGVIHVWRGRRGPSPARATPPWVRGAMWVAMLLLVLYGTVESDQQFIYYQF